MIIMPVAKMVTKPCPACRHVKENMLSTIKDRYEVLQFDLRYDQNANVVKMWSSITNKVPATMVKGNDRTEWFIGVGGHEELYNMCADWPEKTMNQRKVTEPMEKKRDVYGGFSVKETISPKIPKVKETAPEDKLF